MFYTQFINNKFVRFALTNEPVRDMLIGIGTTLVANTAVAFMATSMAENDVEK